MASLVLVLATGASADDFSDDFADEYRPVRQEPRLQVAFGFGFRVDDLNQYRYVPSVSGRLYFFFHRMVALRTGLVYNSLTKLNSSTSYRTLALDVGLRVNARETTVIPFIETGLWLPIYWGTQYGRDYTDYQPGLRFAIGLSFAANETMAFDLIVSQVLNHVFQYRDMVMSSPPFGNAPCRIGENCFPRDNPTGAYNATRFEFVVRIRL